MSKTPKWKQDFNRRMRAHLTALGKCKERPDRLTKWTYSNGRVDVVKSYNRGMEYIWVPNKHHV